MTLCVGDEEVSVSCEYDDTPWPGRADDYNGMRRYYLLTDGPRQFAVNAAWELPAWVIEQATGSRAPDAAAGPGVG
jgi:hypothetical protein